MGRFNFFKGRSFGIDLGNNNTLVSDEDNILIAQPSYITFHTINHSIKAIGTEAYNMFEKTHQELVSIKPLKGGVIADFESASRMIRQMISGAYINKSRLEGYDNIISGVPYSTTEVERRALRAALDQFNARNTYLMFEPLAAALGMGLNIQEPDGKLVIDIGGGLTEIVVISLSGIAAFQSIKIAGDTFDVEIQDHFRRKYNMAIGLKTAEQVKIEVGAVIENINNVPTSITVKGKDLVKGLPVIRTIDHKEVVHIIDKSVSAIEHSIVQTLETCPPELAADIYVNGLFVTGGSALIRGLKERLEARIKLPVHIDANALTSVSKGLAKALKTPEKYKSILFQ